MKKMSFSRAALLIAAGLASFILSAAGCATTAGPADPSLAKPYASGPEQTALDLLEKSGAEKKWARGWSVSASGDGSVYVVGFPYTPVTIKAKDADLRVIAGFANIFEKGMDNSSARLATNFEKLCGAATAVSADGSLVVVGAPGMKAADEGYVYAYLRGPSGWKKEGDYPTLFGVPGPAGSRFGAKIAISGTSGTTVLVGAPGENGYGRARYFIAPPGGWSSLKEGMPSGYLGAGGARPGDEFGRSVAISRDDSTIVIGAPGRDGGKGAVFVFKKPAGGWTNTRDLFPVVDAQGKPGDRFGQSVAVSGDGSLIAIGADGAQGGAGLVYVLDAGDLASGKVNLTGLPAVKNVKGLGICLDMSLDGKTIAAGSFGRDYGGAFTVFKNKGGSWTQNLEISTTTANAENPSMKNALLGFSLDLSDDGTQLLYGVPLRDGGAGSFAWKDLTKPDNPPAAAKPAVDKSVFLLKHPAGDQNLKILDAAEVKERWEPGNYIEYSRFYRGRLQEDQAIRVGDGMATAAKDSPVVFTHNDNRLDVIEFRLAADVEVGFGKEKIRFKNGTTITAFAHNYFAGRIAGEKVVRLPAGGELVCPDESKFQILSDELDHIVLSKPAVFRFNGQTWTCLERVSRWSNKGIQFSMIVLAKTQAINTGGFRFQCPERSRVIIANGRLETIFFEKEVTLPVAGKNEKIPAGKAAKFDEKGKVKEIYEPKGGF